jgi:hypothetical protein
MKLSLFKSNKKQVRKSLSDYKEDLLIKQGREQFEKLVKKGLNIPVAFL